MAVTSQQVFFVSKNDSPLSGRMSDFLPEDDDRYGEKHNENVDTSLGAECVNVACLCDPWNDGVQEAKRDDVLPKVSVMRSLPE